MYRMKKEFLLCICAFLGLLYNTKAQETFPVNDVADPRHGYYAFTNATIVKDAATTLQNAVMIIKDGKIVSVGSNMKVPTGAVEINCAGKYIYPSFIDIYSDYGTPAVQRPEAPAGFFARTQ